jgi:hypothetical protein
MLSVLVKPIMLSGIHYNFTFRPKILSVTLLGPRMLSDASNSIMLSIIQLSFIILSTLMLGVIILNEIMLIVTKPSVFTQVVIMLSVIILNV